MINFLGRSVEASNFYFDATLILFVCTFVGWSLFLLYVNQLLVLTSIVYEPAFL